MSFKKLLDRDLSRVFMAENFSNQIKLLNDVTDYGSNIIPRCWISSAKELKDTILLGSFLKQVVQMIDAISVQVNDGCIGASHAQLRIIAENYFLIKWLIKERLAEKANYYIVWNQINRKKWLLSEIERKKENLDEIEKDKFVAMIKDIDRILAQDDFRRILHKFQSKKYHLWFQPLGPSSIKHLAVMLDALKEYENYYANCSEIAHNSTYEDHLEFSENSIGFIGIRDPSKAGILIMSTVLITSLIFQEILEYYRPEEVERFREKYINDWRKSIWEHCNVEPIPPIIPSPEV